MALKMTITADVFDKLPEDIKKEYKKRSGGDDYQLDLDGYEDPAELKRAKDRLADDVKDLKKELKETGDKLKAIEGDDARKSGDIDRLDKRWESRFNQEIGKRDEVINTLKNSILTEKQESFVRELAGELATNPAVMIPHIASRVHVEFDQDNKPITVFKNKEGKPDPALKREDFIKEWRDNKDFAGIVKPASQATGGGAPRNDPANNGGAGQFRNTNPQPGQATGNVPFHNLSPEAAVAAIESNRRARGLEP